MLINYFDPIFCYFTFAVCDLNKKDLIFLKKVFFIKIKPGYFISKIKKPKQRNFLFDF